MKMKKVVGIVVLAILSISAVSAQNLGARLGYGVELSYQHLMRANRLELNLGLSDFNGGLNLAGTYQWVKPLEGNFSWYFGCGAGVRHRDNSFGLAALGQLGIEYNFSIPVQLSLDWRPGLTLVPEVGFWATSVGFSVRYRF
jgi:hypothetical protein